MRWRSPKIPRFKEAPEGPPLDFVVKFPDGLKKIYIEGDRI